MTAVVMNTSLIQGRSPTSIEAEIGERIRKRRLLLGVNQKTLAKALGVSQQQMYKYEQGINGIGHSRLATAADVLGVPMSYFFEDMRAPPPSQYMPLDLMEQPETLQLMRVYYAIPHETVRHQILAILEGVASAPVPEVQRRSRGRPRRRDDPRPLEG